MEITVRAVHDEQDYEVVLAEIGELMDAQPGSPDGDRLDVLVTLVEAYEARHWPVAAPNPIDAIRIRMQQKNLRPRDLEPMIGSRGRVSEILSGRRSLTLPMIRRLSRGLDLEASVLIQEVARRPPRRGAQKSG